MAKKAARRRTSAIKKATRRRRTPPPRPMTLPDLFQRYYDLVLRGPGGGPGECCLRLEGVPFHPRGIGPGFANILLQNFPQATPEQIDQLREFPPDLLQLFKTVLHIAIPCPFGDGGYPILKPYPGPLPDPPPDFHSRPSRNVKFSGVQRKGAVPTLEISLPSRGTIGVKFVAPRIY